MSTLGDALAGAGVTPCERSNCGIRYRCEEQLLCCDAFRWYVKTGLAVSPYIRLEKRGKTKHIDVIDATHEKYLMMSRDEA